jgi:3-oxoisoapionate kinase
MSAISPRPNCIFIGDDFTGASDTLASFARASWRTRLFLVPPTLDEIRQYEIVGLAAALRSMDAATIAEELDALGPLFVSAQARFYHYKVCSTFDSSETVGSIGAAVNTLSRHLRPALTIIVGGQPSLGRYCHFGHLFARASDDEVYRIDQHPVMAHHPITPMSESDLRIHLGRQGLAEITLINGPEIEGGAPELARRLETLANVPGRIILVDAGQQEHIQQIGLALRSARIDGPLLLVGSSSVAEVLGTALGGPLAQTAERGHPYVSHQGPVFIFAGSRSSVTANQVRTATNYEKFVLSPGALSDPTTLEAFAELVGRRLSEGANTLVHLDPDADYGVSGHELSARCARFVVMAVRDKAVCGIGVAGGDTSSLIVAALGIRSVVHMSDLDRGVAICLGDATGGTGPLPLMLKGGQMGEADLFDRFLERMQGDVRF